MFQNGGGIRKRKREKREVGRVRVIVEREGGREGEGRKGWLEDNTPIASYSP